MIDNDQIDFFHKRGWLIIKNLFTKDEVADLREKVILSHQQNLRGDLLSNPYLSQIIFDDRIVSIVGKLLGTPDPVYFGDSNFQYGHQGAVGFHKDNPDKFDGDAPDWKSPYTIIRLGIYTQDHKKHSGCLALRDKSHTMVSTRIGKPFLAATEPGDLVIWTLRTSHSGFGKRLRVLPNLFIRTGLYRFLPEFLFLPEEKLRVALFLTYAKSLDNHLERYLRYLKTRTYMVDIWQNSSYPPEIKSKAEQAGLRVLDLHEEAKQIDINKTNKAHVDLKN
jgi:hypothetical protein